MHGMQKPSMGDDWLPQKEGGAAANESLLVVGHPILVARLSFPGGGAEWIMLGSSTRPNPRE
jgi:hypothetical protein